MPSQRERQREYANWQTWAPWSFPPSAHPQRLTTARDTPSGRLTAAFFFRRPCHNSVISNLGSGAICRADCHHRLTGIGNPAAGRPFFLYRDVSPPVEWDSPCRARCAGASGGMADALDLKSSGGPSSVGVRIPPRPPALPGSAGQRRAGEQVNRRKRPNGAQPPHSDPDRFACGLLLKRATTIRNSGA